MSKKQKTSVTPEKKKTPQNETFDTANEFHKVVIQNMDKTSIFQILLEKFNYYFFSHIQNLNLEIFETIEIVAHFQDFFGYTLTMYQGSTIPQAYASYYVNME